MRSSRTLYLETLEDRTALSATLGGPFDGDHGPQRGQADPPTRNTRTVNNDIHVSNGNADPAPIHEVNTATVTTTTVSPVVQPASTDGLDRSVLAVLLQQRATETVAPRILAALEPILPRLALAERSDDRQPRDEPERRDEARVEADAGENDFAALSRNDSPVTDLPNDWSEVNSSLFEAAPTAVLEAVRVLSPIQPGPADGFRLSAASLPVGYLPADEAAPEPTEVRAEFFREAPARFDLAEVLLQLRTADAVTELSAAPALTPLTRQLFDQLRRDMLVAARKVLTDAQYREFARALQAQPVEQATPTNGTNTGTPESDGPSPE